MSAIHRPPARNVRFYVLMWNVVAMLILSEGVTPGRTHRRRPSRRCGPIRWPRVSAWDAGRLVRLRVYAS